MRFGGGFGARGGRNVGNLGGNEGDFFYFLWAGVARGGGGRGRFAHGSFRVRGGLLGDDGSGGISDWAKRTVVFFGVVGVVEFEDLAAGFALAVVGGVFRRGEGVAM